MFPHIAHLLVHLKNIKYRERSNLTDEEGTFTSFCYLTHESLDMDINIEVHLAFFTSIAAHFSSISNLLLGTSRTVSVDAGLLVLAKGCTALKNVQLCVCITDATLVEFCRLQPSIVKLILEELSGPTYSPAGVRQALPFLQGKDISLRKH